MLGELWIRRVPESKLPVLAKVLDCRIDDLFPEMDTGQLSELKSVKTDSAGGFAQLDPFDGLTPAKRKVIVEGI